MAQRYQVSTLLGGLNSGYTRNRKYIALLVPSPCDQFQGATGHANLSAGDGNAVANLLVANVYHVGVTPFIEVGQFTHGSFPADLWRILHAWFSEHKHLP
jgi:hypothetical protein|tara:strand:- start:6503 stop:6802 length:300 start_codon:yes stop_codon:yes gene_type:complete